LKARGKHHDSDGKINAKNASQPFISVPVMALQLQQWQGRDHPAFFGLDHLAVLLRLVTFLTSSGVSVKNTKLTVPIPAYSDMRVRSSALFLAVRHTRVTSNAS
jgi:hypothetical protein